MAHKQIQQVLGQQTRRSSKRSVSGAPRDSQGNTLEEGSEDVFTTVKNRKKRRKDLASGKATPAVIPGVDIPLQPSYQHFVSNTPGNMEKDTLNFLKRTIELDHP